MHAGAAEFSTVIGPEPRYAIRRMVVDQSGNTYLAGGGTNFLGDGAIANSILKLDPAGALVLRIDLKHYIADIAVDAAGYIYVTGAGACDFPNQNLLEPSDVSGSYMVKFHPRTGEVIYSTCFLGVLNGIAVDRSGRIWLTGTIIDENARYYANGSSYLCGPRLSYCADLIVLPSAADRYLFHETWSGDPDPNCRPQSSSTCQLKPRNAEGAKIAIDGAGDVYVMYRTATGSWATKRSGKDYKQMNDRLRVKDMAVDSSGNLYVAGSSSAGMTTTAGAYQRTPAGKTDAFAQKYAANGTLLWSTFIGGKGDDTALAVTPDAGGNVWVSGATNSDDFPNALGRFKGEDFIVSLNPSGTALTYSGRFPGGVAGRLLAIDWQGIVRTVGSGGVVHAFSPYLMGRRLFGFANAAFGPTTGLAAPGELVSLYGAGIGPPVSAAAESAAGMLPKSLAGIQVYFDEFPAALLYVSDTQINAVVPFGIAGRRRARVRIVVDGTSVPEFQAVVTEALPEVFRLPNGAAAALNDDGTLNSAANPAKAGSAVSLWVNGGAAPDHGSDGAVAREAKDYACIEASDLYEIRYSGAAPGIVLGVCQVNLVPRRIPGVTWVVPHSVTVKARGWVSGSVAVYVAP